MASANWSLQQAIYAKLTGDTPLTTLLGGAHVHDDVPRQTEPPYVTIGQSSIRDWSTATEGGEEHTLTMHVWSRAKGRAEVNAIMAAIDTALHDQALTLAGHRLVNLRREFCEARRDSDGETYHGLVRFRAVTEPL